MGLSEPKFYILGFFTTVVLMFMLMSYGIDVSINPDIIIDNSSVEYVNNLETYIFDNGIVDFSTQNISSLKKEGLLSGDDETGQQSISDVLATYNTYRSEIKKTTSYFLLFYHLPNLYLLSLGMDVTELSQLTCGITIILYISLILLFIKLVRGS